MTTPGSRIESRSGVMEGRFGHTACLLKDRLVIFGGACEDAKPQAGSAVSAGSFSVSHLPASDSTRKYSIVNETVIVDVIRASGQKLDLQAFTPSSRAAHAGVSIDGEFMLIHGGSAGGNELVDDGTYILFRNEAQDRFEWSVLIPPSISGSSGYNGSSGSSGSSANVPGKRYGHSLCYCPKLELVVMYGGHDGTSCLSDVWGLVVSGLKKRISPMQGPPLGTSQGSTLQGGALTGSVWPHLQWSRLKIKASSPAMQPVPRVYHSLTLCESGRASGMLVVFGGKQSWGEPLSDVWGLVRHREGEWDWVKAPDDRPKKSLLSFSRFNHVSFFLGPRLVIAGGRPIDVSKGVSGSVLVYDTETGQWGDSSTVESESESDKGVLSHSRHVGWLVGGPYRNQHDFRDQPDSNHCHVCFHGGLRADQTISSRTYTADFSFPISGNSKPKLSVRIRESCELRLEKSRVSAFGGPLGEGASILSNLSAGVRNQTLEARSQTLGVRSQRSGGHSQTGLQYSPARSVPSEPIHLADSPVKSPMLSNQVLVSKRMSSEGMGLGGSIYPSGVDRMSTDGLNPFIENEFSQSRMDLSSLVNESKKVKSQTPEGSNPSTRHESSHPSTLREISALRDTSASSLADKIIQTLLLRQLGKISDTEFAMTKSDSASFCSFWGISIPEILTLCSYAKKVFQSEDTLVRVRAPVKVFGDVHGQYFDVLRMFGEFGCPVDEDDIEKMTTAGSSTLNTNTVNTSSVNTSTFSCDLGTTDYVFLGDYVDRGRNSLEVIVLLFALKVKYGKRITLIRGNHEDPNINGNYGFREECEVRLKVKGETTSMGVIPSLSAFPAWHSVWSAFNEAFEFLPLAALIEGKILCVHGGIGSHVNSISQIEKVVRPLKIPPLPKNDFEQMITDLLWSDPTDSDRDFGIRINDARDPDGSGRIVKFGPDRVERFLAQNAPLSMILRAHECVKDGFERFAGGKLITVFSATNYCGVHQNAGALLFIKRDLTVVPKLMFPS